MWVLVVWSRKSYLGPAEIPYFISCVTPEIEKFYLDLPQAVKKIENVLWKWGAEVRLDSECVEFVTVPGFIQGWGMQGESNIPSFCF